MTLQKDIYPPLLLLGSGKVKKENALHVDINRRVQPDIVHDLNKLPYPFPDNTFTRIECFDVLEHLDDLMAVMGEIHRIGQHMAQLIITTPHFSSANAYTDPTHKHAFGYYTFDYFTGDNEWSFYTDIHYKKGELCLKFHPSLVNRFVSILANHRPRFYERHLTWIFPAWYLYVKLIVIKQSWGG